MNFLFEILISGVATTKQLTSGPYDLGITAYFSLPRSVPKPPWYVPSGVPSLFAASKPREKDSSVSKIATNAIINTWDILSQGLKAWCFADVSRNLSFSSCKIYDSTSSPRVVSDSVEIFAKDIMLSFDDGRLRHNWYERFPKEQSGWKKIVMCKKEIVGVLHLEGSETWLGRCVSFGYTNGRSGLCRWAGRKVLWVSVLYCRVFHIRREQFHCEFASWLY